MNTYKKSEVAWFCSKNNPRWELSNMAQGMPIYWPLEKSDANLWHSSEHLYHSSKYLSSIVFPLSPTSKTDPCVRKRIRNDKNPMGAKIAQKSAEDADLVRDEWKTDPTLKRKSMCWALELKLYWNPDSFGRVLRETGDLPIVEISSKDQYWGCLAQTNGLLVGENFLGRILMNVRSRIPEVLAGKFSFPEGFLPP